MASATCLAVGRRNDLDLDQARCSSGRYPRIPLLFRVAAGGQCERSESEAAVEVAGMNRIARTSVPITATLINQFWTRHRRPCLVIHSLKMAATLNSAVGSSAIEGARTAMTDPLPPFMATDPGVYEHFMGRWSAPLAKPFLQFAGVQPAIGSSMSAAAPAPCRSPWSARSQGSRNGCLRVLPGRCASSSVTS